MAEDKAKSKDEVLKAEEGRKEGMSMLDNLRFIDARDRAINELGNEELNIQNMLNPYLITKIFTSFDVSRVKRLAEYRARKMIEKRYPLASDFSKRRIRESMEMMGLITQLCRYILGFYGVPSSLQMQYHVLARKIVKAMKGRPPQTMLENVKKEVEAYLVKHKLDEKVVHTVVLGAAKLYSWYAGYVNP